MVAVPVRRRTGSGFGMIEEEAVPELMAQSSDPAAEASQVRLLAFADRPVWLARQSPEIIGCQDSHSGGAANDLTA